MPTVEEIRDRLSKLDKTVSTLPQKNYLPCVCIGGALLVIFIIACMLKKWKIDFKMGYKNVLAYHITTT